MLLPLYGEIEIFNNLDIRTLNSLKLH